jgi:hypothetical protein
LRLPAATVVPSRPAPSPIRPACHSIWDGQNPGPSNATLTLRYTAVVIDSPENIRGVRLDNNVTWDWVGGQLIEGASEVVVVEPTLTLEKDADPRTVPPGGVVTFTLTIERFA